MDELQEKVVEIEEGSKDREQIIEEFKSDIQRFNIEGGIVLTNRGKTICYGITEEQYEKLRTFIYQSKRIENRFEKRRDFENGHIYCRWSGVKSFFPNIDNELIDDINMIIILLPGFLTNNSNVYRTSEKKAGIPKLQHSLYKILNKRGVRNSTDFTIVEQLFNPEEI